MKACILLGELPESVFSGVRVHRVIGDHHRLDKGDFPCLAGVVMGHVIFSFIFDVRAVRAPTPSYSQGDFTTCSKPVIPRVRSAEYEVYSCSDLRVAGARTGAASTATRC